MTGVRYHLKGQTSRAALLVFRAFPSPTLWPHKVCGNCSLIFSLLSELLFRAEILLPFVLRQKALLSCLPGYPMTFSCVALFFPFSLSVSLKTRLLSFDVRGMPRSLDAARAVVKLWSCRWAGPEANTRGNSNSQRVLWNIKAAYLSKLSGADRSILLFTSRPMSWFPYVLLTLVWQAMFYVIALQVKEDSSFTAPFPWPRCMF